MRELVAEIVVTLCWIVLVLTGWWRPALVIGAVQIGFAINRHLERKEAEEARAAKIAKINKKYDEDMTKLNKDHADKMRILDEEKAKLEHERDQLAQALPTRETVCAIDDEILLVCGHVVSVRGCPEFLKAKLAKQAFCPACGEDNERRAKEGIK